MEKIGRNDPCPCGSGKKYKKCHGKTNVIEFPSRKVEEELDRYLLQFQDFMYDNYPHLFPQTKAASQEEEIEHFIRLLYKGLFMPQTDGQTVFQHFFMQKKKSVVRPATADALASWGNSKASIFHYLKEETSGLVHIEDVLNGSEYKVGRERIPLDNEDLKKVPYYIGIVMNWGTFHNFIPLALPNTQAGYDYYISKLETEFKAQSESATIGDFLHHTFLNQFPKWLYMESPDSSDLAWNGTPQQLEVLKLLDEHVEAEDQRFETYELLKNLWMKFCDEQAPIIRKPAVLAATLEYFLHDMPYLGGDQTVTQKEVAQKYEVSTNSISKRYHEIEEFFFELLQSKNQGISGPELQYYVKPSAHLDIERHTYELNKKVEQMNFSSTDEINDYMNHHRNDPFIPSNDKQRAQIKAYEAYESENEEKKRILVDEVLKLDEGNVDGLALQAHFTSTIGEKVLFVLKAINSGYRRLGIEQPDTEVALWQIVEARPLLRAIEFLAELYEENGEIEQAIESYEDIIELNPNDNQGIRSRLIPLYIQEERYKDVQSLLDMFPDDISVENLFTVSLLMIRLGMDADDIMAQLKMAHFRNESVYLLLTGKESIPEKLPKQFTPGSLEEAVIYVHRNGYLWKPHLHYLESIM
ncbi:SEC-C domain-containing protein [Halobacillus shinanisalinarum]|uniref:SEC-C domain-containing protein n=1 Tax=Halobacillus shinanisalinarum TaxID=2932258 RepID=A0ABY4H200_9BACI|nr:SEC-C metal-binding domain-containing protein [Halobacillus shinanisalinarum]UOQ94465.1 SEC-C domain-containing protein [Halobacillus shinanisalinarum]